MNNMRKIILASGSPRRQELLRAAGIEFEVRPSEYEEDHSLELDPHELVRHLAHGKAEDVARHYDDALIIGGDTLIFLHGQPLGKPTGPAQAAEMLRMLSGKEHLLATGFAVLDTRTKRSVIGSDEVRVYFKELTEDDIDWYIKTGEPLDKAGAYAFQGLGGRFVERIEGEVNTVIGLPVEAVVRILKNFEL